MKGRLLALVGLSLLLAACTTPPVTVGLSDVDLDLSVALDTAGKVLFPQTPLAARDPIPGTSVASVTIQGDAYLKSPANVSFDVYAAATDPGTLGCQEVGSPLTGTFYACDASTAGIAKVSQKTIAFKGGTGPVSFTLRGPVLAEGINRQSLYLGAVIGGATAGNILHLKNLTATVQLNVGK